MQRAMFAELTEGLGREAVCQALGRLRIQTMGRQMKPPRCSSSRIFCRGTSAVSRKQKLISAYKEVCYIDYIKQIVGIYSAETSNVRTLPKAKLFDAYKEW